MRAPSRSTMDPVLTGGRRSPIVAATVGPAAAAGPAGVVLYWMPLGAGGHYLRRNGGRLYEMVIARAEHRRPLDLYHSALEVSDGIARFVVEMGPVPDANDERRGVTVHGPVGARAAGRLRVFRYEIRCSRDGQIPNVGEAVASPVRISDEPADARRLIELVPQVPPLVWGRDELRAGDMWNSNSVISWLLERCGLDTAAITPPRGGRAQGWQAGIAAARCETSESTIGRPPTTVARREASTA